MTMPVPTTSREVFCIADKTLSFDELRELMTTLENQWIEAFPDCAPRHKEVTSWPDIMGATKTRISIR